MSTHAQRFWSERDDYHDLAREYERNIEVTHPEYVSSDRLAWYSDYAIWPRTAVTYYEYRGDSVK